MILDVLLAILFVLVVMLTVFAAISFCNEVMLVVLAAIAFVFAVILAVLDAIFVVFVVTAPGNVAMVAELTPPTLLIVVGKVPVPLPVTSPVNVIN